MQIIFAGKAHPADRAGQDLIRRLFLLTQGEFRGSVVFLEDYDIEIGPHAGAGHATCGSTRRAGRRRRAAPAGMKSPVNGGVNVSILDGWWVEGYRGDNGWAIGERRELRRPRTRRTATTQRPFTRCSRRRWCRMFFDRDGTACRRQWLARMKDSIASVVPQFSAHRMVRDYVQEAYLTREPSKV